MNIEKPISKILAIIVFIGCLFAIGLVFSIDYHANNCGEGDYVSRSCSGEACTYISRHFGCDALDIILGSVKK